MDYRIYNKNKKENEAMKIIKKEAGEKTKEEILEIAKNLKTGEMLSISFSDISKEDSKDVNKEY